MSQEESKHGPSKSADIGSGLPNNITLDYSDGVNSSLYRSMYGNVETFLKI